MFLTENRHWTCSSRHVITVTDHVAGYSNIVVASFTSILFCVIASKHVTARFFVHHHYKRLLQEKNIGATGKIKPKTITIKPRWITRLKQTNYSPITVKGKSL